MTRKTRSSLSAGFVLAAIAAAPAAAQPKPAAATGGLPTDAEVRRMLAERVERLAGKDDGVGIVVGIIGPEGRRVVSYGHFDQKDPRPLDGDTLCELGSVGKVFTALLLADMVHRGEVALADPAAKYLPADVRLPERNGRPITLADLATHTSGLPFMPDTLPASDDPAAATYGARELYRYLAGFKLTRDPGTAWDYSNLGYWLLGQALAGRAGTDTTALLQTRVLAPLGLKSTVVTPTPALKARLAIGHDAVLGPAPSFDTIPVYSAMGPSIGGVYSTVDDLLTLVAVALGYERSPLAPSLAAMLEVRRPMGEAEQALGWVVIGKGDDAMIFHDGGTWGFASAVAWEPKRRVGVAVLSNQQSSVSDLARHLLRPEVPLESPTATRRTEIKVDGALLDACAGRFEAEGEGVVLITRHGGFLMLELPASWGLPRLRLRAESPREFFTSELPVRISLEVDKDAHVTGILIHPPRGQQAIPARRIATR